ncbi:unnamed protein product [Cochlearia groenlandica]
MEEQRRITSGVLSEPASIYGISGEKRNGNGSEEKDELGPKRVKVRDLVSDTKTNLQSDENIGIIQKPNLSSEHMSETIVSPDADGLGGRTVIDKQVLAKCVKPYTDNDKRVGSSTKQALLETQTVGNDSSNCESRGGQGQVDVVSKNSKPGEASESVVSSQDPSLAAAGKSDSMRRWMEMKRNGFLSGPLGGVAAPTPPAVSTAPVEIIPPQKPQKNKRRSDALKKRNDVPKKEPVQQPPPQVDKFSNVSAPSGLLTKLNPGIINHVRSRKQVCSIIEALIQNASSGERESVREDMALTFKLPSTEVSDNANFIANPEQATSLAVQAATVASQWLEFLHQDLCGRLSAVQESRSRVQMVLTSELPLLVSSRESNQESTLLMTNTNTSSDKTVSETHQMKWSAKFYQLNKALYDEEKDLERSLNQVKEMQSRCNEGLRQMNEYSPFSSQSSDSSFGGSNMETSMAVQAAAASIFSTCSFLLSMMKPSPTSS